MSEARTEIRANESAKAQRGYRRDIDGLRAVAILLVILYHINQRFAPNGFVGVDVFFVISGFVVIRSTFSFSVEGIHAVAQFWRRRILRILPPLLLATGFTFLLIAAFTPPFPAIAYKGNIRTGISSLLGLGNLYLFKGSSDYFRNDSVTNSFLHTWSLGVEEQFYLLFALLFILGIGLIKFRRTRATVSLTIMSTFGIFSYAGFLLAANRNPLMVYYNIPFRFWEIAAGGVLAYAEVQMPGIWQFRSHIAASALQVFAVIVVVAVTWFYIGSGFPIAQITGAVLATALLIAVGSHGSPMVSRFLSSRVLVGIGLISYSLYLWHYPLLLFWRTNFGLHFVGSFTVLLSILGAAVLSYRTIERKFRYSKASFRGILLPTLITTVICITAFAFVIQSRPGIFYVGHAQRWSTDWEAPASFAYSDNGHITFTKCDLVNGTAIMQKIPETCYSSGSGTPRSLVLLVGDSHAYSDWAMASTGAEMGEYWFATVTDDGCPIGGEADRVSDTCRYYWAEMPTLVQNTLQSGDSLFISAYWPLKNQSEINHALNTISMLAVAAGKKDAEVIVEASLPSFGRPAYFCTEEWYRINFEGCSVERLTVEQNRAEFLSQIQRLRDKNLNVRLWDALDALCPTTTCGEFRGSAPLFRDDNHLSYYGSKSLGPAFVAFWKNKAH